MPNLPAKIRAVSDTGPLISAFQCGRVDLLERYFEAIHIPESELAEFGQHNARHLVDELIERGFVVVESLTAEEKESAEQLAQRIAQSPLSAVKDPAQHFTKAEAMVLMDRQELDAAVILLEEKAAREIADRLGFSMTGFVGVLLMACAEKRLTPQEMRSLLETCRQQGTHYGDALIDDVYRRCEELAK